MELPTIPSCQYEQSIIIIETFSTVHLQCISDSICAMYSTNLLTMMKHLIGAVLYTYSVLVILIIYVHY